MARLQRSLWRSFRAWLQQPDMHAHAKEVLSASYYAPTEALFDWNGISTILAEHYEGTRSNRTLLWALLSFQMWARRFGATM